MITIKEMLGDVSDVYSLDEDALVKISDKLWEIGKLVNNFEIVEVLT